MNKLCVLSFSMLLCLAGCKDSENNSAKDQAFRADMSL
jgi:hypothetical protein